MPNLITFLTALLALVATGAGVFGGVSMSYGSFIWLRGDHNQGSRFLVSGLIGIGLLLVAAVMGTGIAALPH